MFCLGLHCSFTTELYTDVFQEEPAVRIHFACLSAASAPSRRGHIITTSRQTILY